MVVIPEPPIPRRGSMIVIPRVIVVVPKVMVRIPNKRVGIPSVVV